jgi:hypothetical protein
MYIEKKDKYVISKSCFAVKKERIQECVKKKLYGYKVDEEREKYRTD